jgi:chitin synthase
VGFSFQPARRRISADFRPEYEAELWENGTQHGGTQHGGTQYGGNQRNGNGSRSPSRGPGSRAPSPGYEASQAGDYYRDTNKLAPQQTGGSRLKSKGSNSNMSQYAQPAFAPPQLPFMPFAGSPGSAAGSDYGVPAHGPMMAQMPYQQTGGSIPYQQTGGMYGMMMPQHTGSVYGMPAPSMMAGGFDSSVSQFAAPTFARPMSTFSMATSVNPFAGPNQNPNPTEEELTNALRLYLGTQDLMTVTKKYVSSQRSFAPMLTCTRRTTREAIAARFPKADLSSRKDFLNESIDKILSQS